MPTVTVISTEFAPLAQVTGQGQGHMSLPIVVVPHPVGDRDETLVQRRGEAIAGECARILTTPVDRLSQEYERKVFPLTSALMPR